MTKADFLENLKDILERDEDITEDMQLDDIEEWDSLAAMGVMAFFNKSLSIVLLHSEIREINTVSDLLIKAGIS